MSDDPKHSYYIYIHRERATGTPFYVGIGRGGRACDSPRTLQWFKKVRHLRGAYDTDIVADNLSEQQAYDLEEKLITQHGQVSDRSGTLINIMARVVSAEIEAPRLMVEAHDDRGFSRVRTLRVAEAVAARMGRLWEALYRLLDGRQERPAMGHPETELEESLDEALCEAGQAAEQLLHRRISYEEFHEALDSDLEYYVRDADEWSESPEVIRLARQAEAYLRRQVMRIERGSTERAHSPGGL